MSILCKFGKHKWQGCKCEKCGALRDFDHDFSYYNPQAVKKYGSSCKCRRCGKVRDQDHNWWGCKCNDCGKIRDEKHDYLNGICKRCGKSLVVDLPNMSENDRALLIFDPKYSYSTRMEALDSISIDSALSTYKKPVVSHGERYSIDDEIAQAFLDRLPQETLKELVSSDYWSAAVKVKDTDFLIEECKKANSVSKYIQNIESDRKQVILQALLEMPSMREKACLAMGGHQRDKNCKCTRCGVIAHDWVLVNGYRFTEVETYRCRYCGKEEHYQVNA